MLLSPRKRKSIVAKSRCICFQKNVNVTSDVKKTVFPLRETRSFQTNNTRCMLFFRLMKKEEEEEEELEDRETQTIVISRKIPD